MTRKDRMLAAARREPVDHVPFCTYNLHPYGNSSHARDESYKELLALVEEKAGMDCKVSASRAKKTTNIWDRESKVEETDGHTIRTDIIHTPKGDLRSVNVTPPDQPSMVTEHYIKSDEDIDKYMSLPWEPPEYDVTSLVEFQKEMGDRGLLYISYADPMYAAASLFDFQEFAIRCITSPDGLQRLIDFLFERIQEETRRLAGACSDLNCILYTGGPEIATPPMLPPQVFRRFITPYQRKLVEIIHDEGCLCAIHCHGRVRRDLDEIIATGTDLLEPIEPPEQGDIGIAELMERADGRMSFMGHIQDQELHTARPGEMARKVEEIARVVDGRTGYIMSPTCTPFQHPATETYIRNYMEWVETAARVFGY